MRPKLHLSAFVRNKNCMENHRESMPGNIHTNSESDEMSKLSEAVKALINAPHARPGLTKASGAVTPALARFANDAREKKVGLPAWVTMSVSFAFSKEAKP